MANFVLQITLVLSLGFIIFLFARAIPRVNESDAHTPTDALEKKLERWIAALPLHRIDRGINLFLEKVLRKLRIVILKVDNVTHSFLAKVKSSDAAAKDVEEKSGQKELF